MSLLLLCWLLSSVVAFPFDYLGESALAALTGAQASTNQRNLKSSSELGWADPRLNGGRFLDYTTKKYGEPLNVIVSGLSDPFILTDAGFKLYVKSLGYSEECLGLHMGQLHDANLGDGDGRTTELFLMRQYYFPVWGTCWESIAGGHHFRAWKQNGTLANTGAWFIGASKEYDSTRSHKIIPNGYNIGRDWFVDRAVRGGTWRSNSWKAEVEYREDLIEEGKKGVNHGIAQDGRVAILTVVRLDAEFVAEQNLPPFLIVIEVVGALSSLLFICYFGLSYCM
ncbi:hypothetical protein GALMADRAFT_238775 [Galerina marginata CBS 339.88]|uniref:Uncharacterized protein n=1 Tax=Galerina marginata (strain CBS 339.88) TaxID=685588 RepID=A0A067TII6_GALM3|nr:hypothetical protein GALMADRAFT_238775 [Galerina marginata CBS 339.88]